MEIKIEKRSKHYGDLHKWVNKVIQSCETKEQIRSTKQLIGLFKNQMEKNKVNEQLIFTIISDLEMSLIVKTHTIKVFI